MYHWAVSLLAKNMPHQHTICLNFTIMTPINYLPYQAFTPTKQALTHRRVRGHDHSFWFTHTHRFVLFFHTPLHANKQRSHQRGHAHIHRQSLIPLSYNCSVKHNFTFHISQPWQTYLFMIPVQGGVDCKRWLTGQTYFSVWKHLHAFVRLYNMYSGSARKHQGCGRHPVSSIK